jgi:hypothetical protein
MDITTMTPMFLRNADTPVRAVEDTTRTSAAASQ